MWPRRFVGWNSTPACWGYARATPWPTAPKLLPATDQRGQSLSSQTCLDTCLVARLPTSDRTWDMRRGRASIVLTSYIIQDWFIQLISRICYYEDDWSIFLNYHFIMHTCITINTYISTSNQAQWFSGWQSWYTLDTTTVTQRTMTWLYLRSRQFRWCLLRLPGPGQCWGSATFLRVLRVGVYAIFAMISHDIGPPWPTFSACRMVADLCKTLTPASAICCNAFNTFWNITMHKVSSPVSSAKVKCKDPVTQFSTLGPLSSCWGRISFPHGCVFLRRSSSQLHQSHLRQTDNECLQSVTYIHSHLFFSQHPRVGIVILGPAISIRLMGEESEPNPIQCSQKLSNKGAEKHILSCAFFGRASAGIKAGKIVRFTPKGLSCIMSAYCTSLTHFGSETESVPRSVACMREVARLWKITPNIWTRFTVHGIYHQSVIVRHRRISLALVGRALQKTVAVTCMLRCPPPKKNVPKRAHVDTILWCPSRTTMLRNNTRHGLTINLQELILKRSILAPKSRHATLLGWAG